MAHLFSDCSFYKFYQNGKTISWKYNIFTKIWNHVATNPINFQDYIIFIYNPKEQWLLFNHFLHSLV